MMPQNVYHASSFNRYRVIEINKLGQFYVFGSPPFCHVPFEKHGKKGFIIVEKSLDLNKPAENILFKMKNNKIVAPAMFIKEDMAEEICFILNKKIK